MARDPKAFGGGAAAPGHRPPASRACAPPLTTEDLAAFLERLPTLDIAVPDAERTSLADLQWRSVCLSHRTIG